MLKGTIAVPLKNNKPRRESMLDGVLVAESSSLLAATDQRQAHKTARVQLLGFARKVAARDRFTSLRFLRARGFSTVVICSREFGTPFRSG